MVQDLGDVVLVHRHRVPPWHPLVEVALGHRPALGVHAGCELDPAEGRPGAPLPGGRDELVLLRIPDPSYGAPPSSRLRRRRTPGCTRRRSGIPRSIRRRCPNCRDRQRNRPLVTDVSTEIVGVEFRMHIWDASGNPLADDLLPLVDIVKDLSRVEVHHVDLGVRINSNKLRKSVDGNYRCINRLAEEATFS